MRVIQIIPGSGGNFYCQNCLRDTALTQALIDAGTDAMIAPMYLPILGTDQNPDTDAPVFYGAINVYLKQKLPFLRHLPNWLQNMFNAPGLLRWAAARSGSTTASGLEEMTMSVLQGRDGRQAEELDQLTDWLAAEAHPDIVHLSNGLLLGLAPAIREKVGVPIVCSLQDEDVWVDAMAPEWTERIWQEMSALAEYVDMFTAVSNYFAGRMQDRLELPDDKVTVVPVGIDPDGYEPAPEPPEPPAIGFLSRLNEQLGFGILAEAFLELKQDPAFAELELHATGGILGDDRKVVERWQHRFEDAGIGEALKISEALDRDARQAFLRGLRVLSVPIPKGEAFGLFQIEAMAAGVPVVQPAVGAFPEIVNATGGGVLYEPNEPAELAKALRELLTDSDRIVTLGRQGRDAVLRSFTIDAVAQRMLEVYQALQFRSAKAAN